MAVAITFTFIGAFLVASIVGVFLTEAHPRYLMHRERKRAMQRILKVAESIVRQGKQSRAERKL
jgi:hypothetical protein